MGELPSAFDHLKNYFTIDKEIFSQESKKSMDTFNMRLAIADKELHAEVQKIRVEQLEMQLTSQATQLVTQTELLAKFRDELREIVQKYPFTEPGMREVKEKLKELPCKSIDWEKFEAEFKAVHPEFSRKLHEKFPKLTPTEAKICSLLRLNLKSHEIARLFCLSERSVETHRFNIRRKLGMDREKSLSLFLNSL
jgi:DNA-binding CsgD family transcriptional regulator/septum formation topological specificity factor MinE